MKLTEVVYRNNLLQTLHDVSEMVYNSVTIAGFDNFVLNVNYSTDVYYDNKLPFIDTLDIDKFTATPTLRIRTPYLPEGRNPINDLKKLLLSDTSPIKEFISSIEILNSDEIDDIFMKSYINQRMVIRFKPFNINIINEKSEDGNANEQQ